MKKENEKGAIFIKYDPNNKKKYIIKCKYCGELYSIWIGHYYRGSNPCYCFRKGVEKRLIQIYQEMKERCYNSKCKDYCRYGAKGIAICDEWLNSSKAFYDWALLNGYDNNLTLDRKNYNLNYSPDNCRWITISEQCSNTKANIAFIIDEYRTSLKRFCRVFNLNYKVVQSYYYYHKKNKEKLLSYLKDKIKYDNIRDFTEDDYDKDILPETYCLTGLNYEK